MQLRESTRISGGDLIGNQWVASYPDSSKRMRVGLEYHLPVARAWAWLSANQGALGLVVTVLGVVVAYAYVRLTRKLAVATNRQADLTQALFETGHRPWLAITCKYNRRNSYREDYPASWDIEVTESQDFILTTENKGSVPAVIIAWQVVVEREGDEPRISRSQGGAEAVVYTGVSERLAEVTTISDTWGQTKRLKDGEMVWEGGGDKAQAAKKSVRVGASPTSPTALTPSTESDRRPKERWCARRSVSTRRRNVVLARF